MYTKAPTSRTSEMVQVNTIAMREIFTSESGKKEKSTESVCGLINMEIATMEIGFKVELKVWER